MTPSFTAKVTDAMVEAGLRAAEEACVNHMLGEFREDRTFDTTFTDEFKERFRLMHRAALVAAIGAGGQAVDTRCDYCKEHGFQHPHLCEDCRAAQEAPADEQSGETLSTWKLPPYDAPPKTVVDEQAEDESLWFKAETITENILQKALRRLHASVEAAALAAEPGEAINRLRAGTQEGWRQKIEEIRARVERTICPTFSSDSGDIGEQGRISREDFDTLVISALGNAAPSPEAKGGRS